MTKAKKIAHVETVIPLPIVRATEMPNPEFLTRLIAEKIEDDKNKPAQARFNRLRELAKEAWGIGPNARREAWILPHPTKAHHSFMVRVAIVEKQCTCNCPAPEYTRHERHLKIEACGPLPDVS